MGPSAAAWTNLGTVLQHMGEVEEALEAFSHAIAIDGARPLSHYNLGVSLHAQGRVAEALLSFQRAAELDPRHLPSAYNIGVVYQELGEPLAAAQSYRAVLELDPLHSDARLNYCNTLSSLAAFDMAERCYLDLLSLHPSMVRGMVALAGLYHSQTSAEALSAALELYRRVLDLEPGNAMARHGAAALSGESASELDADYVRELFDGYSGSFDASLASLDYRAPDILASLVLRALETAGRASTPKLRVLDLGAGTGLACSALRARAGKLVDAVIGVDVSPSMLRRAEALNCYNQTVVSEVGAFLAGYAGKSFDVILAADVFVYIPRLNLLLGECQRSLSDNGLLSFTVELPPAGMRGVSDAGVLLPTGRYAHSQSYVEDSAISAGLLPVFSEPCIPRMDRGTPIEGMAFVFTKTVDVDGYHTDL